MKMVDFRDMSSVVDEIKDERQRQIEKEGYDHAHDDEHDGGEIAWAAACYAAPDRIYIQTGYAKGPAFEDPWPWAGYYDKRPHPSDGNFPEPEKATLAQRRRLLVKSAALIVAEIERLDRTALTGEES